MNKYPSAYCTLNSIIQQLNSSSDNINVSTVASQTTQINTEDANTQAYLKRLIMEVSGAIARKHNRAFVPYDDTKTMRRGYVRDNLWREAYEYRIEMEDDTLSLSSVTWIGTSLTSAQYRLANENTHPNWEIAIDIDAISTIYPADFDESVQVAGTFGYNRDPDNMWKDSGKTVSGAIGATVTTVTVSDGTVFGVYQYIKIESEYMLITDISTNDLTVERGVNGSTAASHASTTAVYQYQQTYEIEQEARRLAIRNFHLRGGLNDPKSFAIGPETAIEIDPNDVKIVVSRRHVFGTV